MSDLIQSKIIKDLVRYLPQVIIPALVAFISIPVYTRLFDPADYGNLNIVRVSTNLLERGSSWIGVSLTRYYNQYEAENRLPYILTTIIKANFWIGAFITVPALLLLKFLDMAPTVKLLFQIGIILFAISLLTSTLKNVIRMQRRITLHSVYMLVTSVFSFVLSLVLIYYFGCKIESILLGNLIIILICIPFMWRASVAAHFDFKIKFDFGMIKKFASYGIPLTIGTLALWVLDMSDRYMIKIMLSSYDVGVYSACYNVAWNSLFLVVNLFFMMEEPLAMKVYATNGPEALREFLNCETRLFLLVVVPLSVLLCFYSDSILSMLVDAKYRAGVGLVPYIAVSIILSGLIFKYHLGFLAMEKTKILMYLVLLSGVSNVLFNLFLVPYFGIMGAAVATLLSYTIYFTSVVIVSRSIFIWHFPLTSLFKISFSALVSIYSFSLFLTDKMHFLFLGALVVISMIVYLILLLFLGEIKREEFNTLLRYFNKGTVS